MKSPLRLLLVLALSPLLFTQSPGATPDAARSVTSLSGPGWKLWRDTAKWKDDVPFAPPVSPPFSRPPWLRRAKGHNQFCAH